MRFTHATWLLALLAGCSMLGGSVGRRTTPQRAAAPQTPEGEPETTLGYHLDAGELTAGQELEVHVEHPGVRAVREDAAWDAVTMTFRYLGPTERVVALANGEIRRQIGLKIRAVNTCNVLYVMWWIEPADGGVRVSVKSNPGESTHAECGATGYLNLQPEESAAPPPIEVGSLHRLSARLQGQRLEVFADDVMVWRGALPAELPPQGVVGMRSDNVRFEFGLEPFVALTSPSAPGQLAPRGPR